jgi:hypothetical protein
MHVQTEHSLKIIISSVCADIILRLHVLSADTLLLIILRLYVLSAHTLPIIILKLCSVCTYTTNYRKTVCSVSV